MRLKKSIEEKLRINLNVLKHIMNYIRVYWSIIHNRLHNKVDGYVEHHHIIPRSEGGPDNNDNIVALTAREHYICHLLLAKIYNDYKMLSAVVFMQAAKERWSSRTFKFNSRLYEAIRKEFAVKVSEHKKGRIPWNKGKKMSPEACKNMSDAQKKYRQEHPNSTTSTFSKYWAGKKRSEADRKNKSDAAKGKPKKYKNWTEGKTLSEEHRRKISNTLKLRNAKTRNSGN